MDEQEAEAEMAESAADPSSSQKTVEYERCPAEVTIKEAIPQEYYKGNSAGCPYETPI